jgi:hypothetical protein
MGQFTEVKTRARRPRASGVRDDHCTEQSSMKVLALALSGALFSVSPACLTAQSSATRVADTARFDILVAGGLVLDGTGRTAQHSRRPRGGDGPVAATRASPHVD